MKRFSFDAFQVDDANREAFDVCKTIAELKPVSPLPVTIVADNGAGKTHLLYSIVNQIRGSGAKTGLAYVTAKDFPEQVRGLIKDATPVQRAKSAVLLVDQLEDFDELADDLETVVKIFLDSNHYVILASSLGPSRLKKLSDRFRSLLKAGQVVRVKKKASDSTTLIPAGEMDPLAPDPLDDKEGEIHQLRVALEKARAVISAAGDAEELRHQFETEKGKAEELESALAAEQKKTESAQKSIEKLKNELANAKSAAKKSKAESTDANTEQLNEVQGKLDAAQQEIDSLKSQLASKSDDGEAAAGLREQLDQATQEMEQAKREASEVSKRAEILLEKFEENQLEFTKKENELLGQIESLQEIVNTHKDSAAESETKHGELESQLASLREELETVTRSRDEAIEKSNTIAAEAAEKDQELEKLRQLPKAHEKEMETLRQEAADQVAAANMRSGQIEHNLKQVTAAVEKTKNSTQEAIGGLRGLTEQLNKTTTILVQALTEVTSELEKVAEQKIELIPVDEIDASKPASDDPGIATPAPPEMPPTEAEDGSETPGIFSIGSEDEGEPFGAVPLDANAAEDTPFGEDPFGEDDAPPVEQKNEEVATETPPPSEGSEPTTPETVLDAPPANDNASMDDDPLGFDDDDDPLAFGDDDDPLG